ncbi:MAG: hypothetical protein R2809_05370 [Flavobacteriales bacterium]
MDQKLRAAARFYGSECFRAIGGVLRNDLHKVVNEVSKLAIYFY